MKLGEGMDAVICNGEKCARKKELSYSPCGDSPEALVRLTTTTEVPSTARD
jgi:hypothetical protein